MANSDNNQKKDNDQHSEEPNERADQGRSAFSTGTTTQGGSNYGQGSSQLGGQVYHQGEKASSGSNYENEKDRLSQLNDGASGSDTNIQDTPDSIAGASPDTESSQNKNPENI